MPSLILTPCADALCALLSRSSFVQFFPDDYKCISCGADKDAFFDRRDEVAEKQAEGALEYEYENKDDYSGGDDEGGEVDDVEVQREVVAKVAEREVVVEVEKEAVVEKEVAKPTPPTSNDGGDELDLLGMDD